MERFCAGFDATSDGVLALIVNPRDGRIIATGTGRDAQDVFARTGISEKEILAFGFSAPTPLARSWDSLVERTVFAKSRAHASVPGCGVASPSTMVLAFDDRHCTLLTNSRMGTNTGSATMTVDGILPGYFGYQFAPIRFDGSTKAGIEAFAFAVRRACESLRAAGVPVRRFVADRNISTDLLQVLANVLDGRIKIAASAHPAALGAAILAAIRAGSGHATLSQTIHAMAHVRRDLIYRPDLRARKHYDQIFANLK